MQRGSAAPASSPLQDLPNNASRHRGCGSSSRPLTGDSNEAIHFAIVPGRGRGESTRLVEVINGSDWDADIETVTEADSSGTAKSLLVCGGDRRAHQGSISLQKTQEKAWE